MNDPTNKRTKQDWDKFFLDSFNTDPPDPGESVEYSFHPGWIGLIVGSMVAILALGLLIWLFVRWKRHVASSAPISMYMGSVFSVDTEIP